MTRSLPLALAILTGIGTAGALAYQPEEADGCLYGAPLQERYDDAWRRWAVDGEPPRNCDLRALQDASEVMRRCADEGR